MVLINKDPVTGTTIQTTTEAESLHAVPPTEEMVMGGAIRDMTDDELKKMHERTFATQTQYQAEQLRLGISERAGGISYTSVHPPAVAPELPKEQEEDGKLSHRQRRKVRNRQRDNVRKANSRKYVMVTDQTIPLETEMKKAKNEELKRGSVIVDDWRRVKLSEIFPSELFKPSFDMKSPTTIDVRGIRKNLQYAEAILKKMDEELAAGTLSLTEQADMKHLRETHSVATGIIRTTFLINGVDYDTGTHFQTVVQDPGYYRNSKDSLTARYHELVSERKSEGFLTEKTLELVMGTSAYADARNALIADSREQLREEFEGIAPLDDTAIQSYEADIDAAKFGLSVSDEVQAKARKARDELNLRAISDYYTHMKESGIDFDTLDAAKSYMTLLKDRDTTYKQKYEENKEVFNRIFDEYSLLEKFIYDRIRVGYAIERIPKEALLIPAELKTAFSEFMGNDPKYAAALTRHRQLRDAMYYLLVGIEPHTDTQIVLENEFKVITNARREQNDKLRDTPPENPKEQAKFVSEHRKRYRKAAENAQGQASKANMKDYCDARIIASIGTQFELNEEGEPRTQLDAAKRAENQQVIEDIMSDDKSRQTPHFEALITKLKLNVPTPDLLKRDVFLRNLNRIQTIIQPSLMFTNVQDAFGWYFADHPGLSEEMAPIMDVYAAAANVMVNMAKLYGVGPDGRLWTGEDGESMMSEGRKFIADAEEDYQRKYANYLTKVATR